MAFDSLLLAPLWRGLASVDCINAIDSVGYVHSVDDAKV
ncbi:MAG: hypothetical protein RL685_7399 [Pseudomonadota bacterium]|jgi:hypothetical protein